MKRIFMHIAVVVLSFWAAASLGAESRGRPSGTVMIHMTRVALGVGITKGEGYLRYKGDSYRFKVNGLNAVGVGITTLNATGEVYDLHSLDDFPGKYFGAEAGGTFIEGSKGLVVKNNKGVVLNLKAEKTGLALNLGDQGLSITPDWE